MFIETDVFIYTNLVLWKLQMLCGFSKRWQTFCINWVSQSPNLCMYVYFRSMLPIPILPPVKSLLLDLWYAFSRDLLWCGDSIQLVAMICSLFEYIFNVTGKQLLGQGQYWPRDHKHCTTQKARDHHHQQKRAKLVAKTSCFAQVSAQQH